MNIAVIPARGGSKRIPRKNVKIFDGKPMIAYAIEAAFKSDLFEHVIVTTEDAEVGEIARDYGAETPFIRPSELADDFCETVPVIAHALESCVEMGWLVDYVCCIYPAVPLLLESDLLAAYNAIIESDSDYMFPIARHQLPIHRALRVCVEDNRVEPIFPEYEDTRTQDLEPAYFDVGQFYWGKSSAWLARKSIHSNGSTIIIPNERAIDIDTADDWIKAESMKKLLNSILK